jgi:hypothetical protein
MIAGVVFSWLKARRAYQTRKAAAGSAPTTLE